VLDLGQTKVEHLDAVLVDQNVARFKVAVDDALAMRRVQSIEDLARQRKRLVQRQGSLQRLALDVLHHQEVRPHVVERADVGMVQRSDGMRLALEALAEAVVAFLDGDGAVQARVARLPDFAHAAFAQRPKDLVGTQLIARGKRHDRPTILSQKFVIRPSNGRAAHRSAAIPGRLLLKAAQLRERRSSGAETQPHHRDIRRRCGE
jgi:hypothetical protein